MSSLGQKIIHLFRNGTKKIIPYALSLAATTKDHSYAGIAQSLDLNYHQFFLKVMSIDPNIDWMLDRQVKIVKKYQTTVNRGVVIADFTRRAKSKDAQTPLTTNAKTKIVYIVSASCRSAKEHALVN